MTPGTETRGHVGSVPVQLAIEGGVGSVPAPMGDQVPVGATHPPLDWTILMWSKYYVFYLDVLVNTHGCHLGSPVPWRFKQHMNETRMWEFTHFCAGSRCATSLLLRCRLGASKICHCDSIARQWKKVSESWPCAVWTWLAFGFVAPSCFLLYEQIPMICPWYSIHIPCITCPWTFNHYRSLNIYIHDINQHTYIYI